MNKTGIILINIGSPKSPQKDDVRQYLKEFLGDKNILRFPSVFRWILVNCIIIPLRLNRIANAYKIIWKNSKSPLIFHTEAITDQLSKKLSQPIQSAMLYGQPSVLHAFKSLASIGISHVKICPLIPQSVSGIMESIKEKCQSAQNETDLSFEISPPFFDALNYIAALKQSILPFIDQNNVDTILFSFHGLPCSEIRQAGIPCSNAQINDPDCIRKYGSHDCTKCYKFQCIQTANLLAKECHIENKTMIAFQSRIPFMGNWLMPTTQSCIKKLLRDKKKVLIITPSFVCDCLETLYEIHLEGKSKFNSSHALQVTPCLNDNPFFIDFLADFLVSSSTRKLSMEKQKELPNPTNPPKEWAIGSIIGYIIVFFLELLGL